MKAFILRVINRWFPRPVGGDPLRDAELAFLRRQTAEGIEREAAARRDYIERCHELAEASQMFGSGPMPGGALTGSRIGGMIAARESLSEQAPGAFGDLELALQNVEWRREVNLSWLQFSRWGIQSIILISRLYYIKNPIIRRLIDVVAAYVFGRGVEVSSEHEGANEILKDFFARNQTVLGQNALADAERRKFYDGNLFFGLFTDPNTGLVDVRLIDATEMQEIVTDDQDADKPRLYKRLWTQQVFDQATGAVKAETRTAWYPALGYEPGNRPESIGRVPVMWDVVVYHRKVGTVGKWTFGCPEIYPALDWAREARKYLEACASVRQSMAQIALKATTKGGQQAIAGIKQAMQTTVGAQAPLWDTNPTAVAGSTFVSGPGTTLEAFDTRGKGADPEEVRRYLLMCCMCVGVPETFLADVSTGNLATATTLDRPTELVMMARQEAWREDLAIIARYVLGRSIKAPAGTLREAGIKSVREARRIVRKDGSMIYAEATVPANVVEVKVTFPAIREGDIPQLVTATVQAMTLQGGSVHGIDEKAGVQRLYELLGIDGAAELVEQQYPNTEYDPDRTAEPEPEPVPVVAPEPPAGAKPLPADAKESLRRLSRALRLWERKS